MFQIRFSADFLQDIVLAGVEAYALGDGARRRRAMIETIGDVWGSRKPLTSDVLEDDQPSELFFLNSFSHSLAAERTIDSVRRHDDAQALAIAAMEIISPEQRLLGDLHTHPYKNMSEVNKAKGWQFSDEDLDFFLHDDELWRITQNKPLMLALTVCRLSRVHHSEIKWPSHNVIRLDVGEFRFWLNAGVGWLDKDNIRRFSGNTHSKCVLIPPGTYFNIAGARIRPHRG